jgi:hypothetical protein
LQIALVISSEDRIERQKKFFLAEIGTEQQQASCEGNQKIKPEFPWLYHIYSNTFTLMVVMK